MSEKLNESFIRETPTQFTIDSDEYSGLSSAESRRRIKEDLDNKNFSFSSGKISRSALSNLGYDSGKINVQSNSSGIVWVRCYYDGSDDTGIIRTGHPVVFDTVTGKAVTGINPAWKRNEYKIVGIAYKNYNDDSGYGKIPIKIISDHTESDSFMVENPLTGINIPPYALGMYYEGGNYTEQNLVSMGYAHSIISGYHIYNGEENLEPGDIYPGQRDERLTIIKASSGSDSGVSSWGPKEGEWVLYPHYPGYHLVAWHDSSQQLGLFARTEQTKFLAKSDGAILPGTDSGNAFIYSWDGDSDYFNTGWAVKVHDRMMDPDGDSIPSNTFIEITFSHYSKVAEQDHFILSQAACPVS